MAITEMELNEALNRASALMSPEGQRQIERANKLNNNNFTKDSNYRQSTMSQGMGYYTNESVQIPRKGNCKLPKVIQESILNNPISTATNEYSMEGSILDAIGYNKPQANYQQAQETRVFENSNGYYTQPNISAPQYTPQPIPSIDYNYIRTIVNECVQANLQKIKEEILKESSLKTIRLSNENKIQLIDNKNNLFESKLEFRKNITKK